MSGHPHGGQYDDGYGHQQGTPPHDEYYQDDRHNQGYYDNHDSYHDNQQDYHQGGQAGQDGYYDES